jgi:uncharacterized surface protein with fasciclin (FAS1) repeats
MMNALTIVLFSPPLSDHLWIRYIGPVRRPQTSLNMADTALSDIVDTAVAAGSFSTLAALVPPIWWTLESKGPLHCLAHTDEAFACQV